MSPFLCIVAAFGDRTLDEPIVCKISDEETANRIVSELLKRNPKMIASRKFTYQGMEYDAIEQTEAVINLYKSIVSEK